MKKVTNFEEFGSAKDCQNCPKYVEKYIILYINQTVTV